jgi:monoterpene epsilon-lactone hydrolase
VNVDEALPPLLVPAKTLPVPTDVSPEMQRIIAAPRRAGWDDLWETGEECRAAANALAAQACRRSRQCASACT